MGSPRYVSFSAEFKVAYSGQPTPGLFPGLGAGVARSIHENVSRGVSIESVKYFLVFSTN
jgi:hypothetical protein